MTDKLIKLNLGCGQNQIPGHVNVDKFGEPDVRHDLETFPWPWEENSVKEIVLNHTLEHLGQSASIYLKIVKEIYRICAPGATIFIVVPHPRHDHFLNDPTHVRAVTADSLELLSKNKNAAWAAKGCSNSPLGLFLDVDFELVSSTYVLDPFWKERLDNGVYTETEIHQAIKRYNNVVQETRFVLRAVKDEKTDSSKDSENRGTPFRGAKE